MLLCTGPSQNVCKNLLRSAEAIHIHRSFQRGTGSGLDVAASWHGGAILFQNQHVQAIEWPEELEFSIVFTGHSASTEHHVNQFSAWRQQDDTQILQHLCQASEHLAERLAPDTLHTYIKTLEQFDQIARLNIYTSEHRVLAEIARTSGVFYKPCGAGGGDIGMAMQWRSEARPAIDPLTQFKLQAAQKFTVLDLKVASTTR